MRFKTILACLTTPERSREVLRAASILGRKTHAHLIGLHTRDSALAYAGASFHMPSGMILEFDRSQDDQAEAVKAVFDAETDGEEFVSEWRVERTETASATVRTLESCRAADVVLVAQPDPEKDQSADRDLIESLIRGAGRPVLVVPRGFNADSIGRSVLVGWSGTREATRASHDAISIADPDAEVFLLTVSRRQKLDPLAENTARDMAAALARHGLRPTTCYQATNGMDIAEIMSRQALERDADLIATGAFGHSSIYDFVIGAVTRDLIRNARVPALFSK